MNKRFEIILKNPISYKRNNIKFIPEISGLYFFKTECNELLYIGLSENLNTRVTAHLKGSTTYSGDPSEISVIEIYPCDYELQQFEAYCIERFQPKHNQTLTSEINRQFKKSVRIKDDDYEGELISSSVSKSGIKVNVYKGQHFEASLDKATNYLLEMAKRDIGRD
ncbi:GIY-YIG nuclease family protein [Alkalihalophilus pseudofirmus]|uniref:GIY-YIG nuclease family protein n=1 Tax=Alkalihalophilus pseudofirmus TaxID=79885 RepID=UPI00259AEF40|nr:GIY-YIG nuclease family protein [Alkalihalophilus pseudofirmus]WEG18593.1 GIY-YIG nuclease family protein [Alkalihalophilus pseudofirmus]